MVVPTYSKIKLCALFVGSLLFLIGSLKGGTRTGNRRRRLSAITGLTGLVYIALELCWYFYFGFLQSRDIALAYYFSWKFWGGVVVIMFLYVVYRNAKILLAASAVLLAAFNLFVIARHLGRSLGVISHGDGLFGGMFLASLLLLSVDQQSRNISTKSAIPPRATENKP